jgi:hypothetical protein
VGGGLTKISDQVKTSTNVLAMLALTTRAGKCLKSVTPAWNASTGVLAQFLGKGKSPNRLTVLLALLAECRKLENG